MDRQRSTAAGRWLACRVGCAAAAACKPLAVWHCSKQPASSCALEPMGSSSLHKRAAGCLSITWWYLQAHSAVFLPTTVAPLGSCFALHPYSQGSLHASAAEPLQTSMGLWLQVYSHHAVQAGIGKELLARGHTVMVCLHG